MGRFRSEEPIPASAVKVQVILSKPLHRAIKAKANEREQSMGRFIGETLAKVMKVVQGAK